MSSPRDRLTTGPVLVPTLAFDSIVNPGTDSNQSPNRKQKIRLYHTEIGNSSGSNIAAGFGYIVPNSMYKVGFYTASGSSISDDTTDAQSSTASDVPLFTVSTNDNGHVISASVRFNIVQYVIPTTANNNGTIAYTYWNGSAWTSFTPITAATLSSTGTTYAIFNNFADWTPFTSSSVTGGTAGHYAIKVAATSAPSSSAALASTVKIVSLLDFLEVLQDGQSMIRDYGEQGILLPGSAVATAYCSGANAQNWAMCDYSIEG